MKRTIFWYAVSMALLTVGLKQVEYRYFIKDISLEFYISLIAIVFTVLGVWMGLKWTRKKIIATPPTSTLNPNNASLGALGISTREYEVLQLVAQGCSNQEIADRLYISLNTVKTHLSNLFLKLDVKRRTQAIQKAKEMTLIQ